MVLVMMGSVDERKKLFDEIKDYDVVVTSYDLLKRDVENYEGLHFRYCIADEAQYIKNANTKIPTITVPYLMIRLSVPPANIFFTAGSRLNDIIT